MVEESGQMYVTGRTDDQVKVRGRRVDLAEVRREVEGSPQVAEAWIGIVDERICAVVEAAGQSLPSVADLSGGLRSYARPTRVVVVDRLPRKGSGKIDAAAVRESLAQ